MKTRYEVTGVLNGFRVKHVIARNSPDEAIKAFKRARPDARKIECSKIPESQLEEYVSAREDARNSPKNGYTYADLYDQGFSAKAAAQLRGESDKVAHRWASDHGLRWADHRGRPQTQVAE